MEIPLISVERRWCCPNCPALDITREARPHVRYHICPAQGGMTVPMVPEGIKAKVSRQEREDYIGKEIVQTDANGRPVMTITVERDDGVTNTLAFAPTAQSRAGMED